MFPLPRVTFSLVTVLWIVWTCGCCVFADLLNAHGQSAACKKSRLNYSTIWYILLVLCTCCNHFPFNLSTPRHLKIWMCENERKPVLEPCYEKSAPEPELRHLYGCFVALVGGLPPARSGQWLQIWSVAGTVMRYDLPLAHLFLPNAGDWRQQMN